MTRFAFLREAAWLDVARRRRVLAMLALANVAMVAAILLGSRGGVDRNGFLIGTDFLGFWTAGRMLHHGVSPYDIAAHIAAQRRFFAAPDGFTGFFYPPLFLPICWLLGLGSYFVALALWLAATGAAFFVAIRSWFGRLGQRGPGALLALAFPPALICVTHGQTAFLIATLLGAGSLLVDRRPRLAGVLLGLATIKPQLGLLVPVILVCAGRWQTIGFATLSALALAAVATLAFGPQVWPAWLAAAPTAAQALEGSVGYGKFVSIYAALRLVGAGHGAAMAVQVCAALALIGALAFAALRRGWSLPLAAATLAGAPLATPFVLDYDLAILAFPLALLAADDFRPWERAVSAAAFAMPLFARPLALALGIPIAVPVMLALFAVCLRRALGDQASIRSRSSSPARF